MLIVISWVICMLTCTGMCRFQFAVDQKNGGDQKACSTAI